MDTSLRQPGASSVIYGGVDAGAVSFHVAEALAEPGTDVRLFGKPESFVKRRMGVGLAVADDGWRARQGQAGVFRRDGQGRLSIGRAPLAEIRHGGSRLIQPIRDRCSLALISPVFNATRRGGVVFAQ